MTNIEKENIFAFLLASKKKKEKKGKNKIV